MTEKYIE